MDSTSNANINNGDTSEGNTSNTENTGTIDALQWRPLPERVRSAWIVNQAITTAITLLACAAAALFCIAVNWWGLIQGAIIGVIAILPIIAIIVQPLQTKYEYTFYRFAIGRQCLHIRKGWLFRKSTTIPFNRVQHVDTKQGPVLRHFNLTGVIVHTAVGEHEIEALETDEAERVVALIADLVAQSKEDL